MRILFCTLITFSSISCYSQVTSIPALGMQVHLTDDRGIPLMTKKDLGVVGSVYLFDEYKPGRITVNNRVYNNMNVKLNFEKNIVYFEKDGVEMIPAENVTKLEFLDINLDKYSHVFRNGFPTTGTNTGKTYYQVLDSGKVSLLKQVNIIYRESTAYGSPLPTRSYEQIKSYYLLVNNTLTPIKNSEAFLLAMPDQKNEVSSFLSSKRIKFNREDDLKRVTIYYNNL